MSTIDLNKINFNGGSGGSPTGDIPASQVKFLDNEDAQTKVTELEQNVGDLDDLVTEAKDNLVEAINEAYENGGEIINSLDSDRTDASLSAKQGKALNTALTALQAEVEGFIGAQTNFVGIVANTSDLPTVTEPSWGLVGSDIDALNAYVWNGTAWTQFGTKTYDFTDYLNAAKVANSGNYADLDISDENGNVLARFENGHFRVKNFDSSTDGQTSITNSGNDADLDLADEDGNVLARFENGHFRTKNFDSKEIGNTAYDYLGIENALAAKKCLKDTISPLSNHDQYATIVHITDVHGDAVRAERAFKVARAIRANVVCTGDIVRYNSSDDVSYLHAIISKYGQQYDQCLGNHDTFQVLDTAAYTKHILPLAEAQGWNLPQSVSFPLYYYRDDTLRKLRYISVCQFQDNGTTSHRGDHYKQEQITFIISALSSVPANYGVIIMMHTPEYMPVADAQHTKFYAVKHPYSEAISNKPLCEIVDAFIGKTTINKTIGGLTVSGDFTEVESNEFIAYLCGHLHADSISYVPNTTHRQLLLNEVCTNAWINRNSDGTSGTNYPYYNESSDLARQEGTPLQDAFNVYVIDRDNKQVRVVRIGSNLPYNMSEKRDYMTINY